MTMMLHLDVSKAGDVRRAADLLRQGRLVAFATETVYGLGADALSAEAVAGIFVAKERPSWDPLIVHIASFQALGEIAKVPAALTERVGALAAAFWPGPLTLLLPRSAAVPDAVTAGRELIGVRVPAHPAAQALLRAFGRPIAAPSANRFGHTSPTTAAHVLHDLEGRIDAVLDAGPTPVGIESTVLDPTQTPMMLYRPGKVTAEQLARATGVAVETYSDGEKRATPASLPSPGVGMRHYAPRARLVLAGPTHEALGAVLAAQEPGIRVGVLRPTGWPETAAVKSFDWGSWTDPDALATRLFAGLRALDDAGVDVIVCPLPVATGQTAGIRDRLQKAARAE